MMNDDVMTPAEVGRLFRVDVKTVGRWAKGGLLPFFRTLGGHMRFRRVDVEAAMKMETRVPHDIVT